MRCQVNGAGVFGAVPAAPVPVKVSGDHDSWEHHRYCAGGCGHREQLALAFPDHARGHDEAREFGRGEVLDFPRLVLRRREIPFCPPHFGGIVQCPRVHALRHRRGVAPRSV